MIDTISARKHLQVIGVAASLLGCGSTPRPELPVQSVPQRGVTNDRYRDAIATAESIAAALTASSPAVSVAVAVGDALVWSAAFGFSDLATQTRASPASRFRVYSLSKAMTAATALWLKERGRLDLDAPVRQYLPGHPNLDTGITARRLIGHLGGIRHYRGSEAISTRACVRPADALAIFVNDPLTSRPGSTYLYSSWGYALLSAVIVVAGGGTFESIVMQAVLEPAGMVATGLPGSAQLLAGEVTPYEPEGHDVRVARAVDNRCKWGGGAFVSTAEDIARFGSALRGGTLLPRRAFEEMLAPMTTTLGTSTGYGMGVGITVDSAGRRRAVHSGSAMGGRAAFVMYPDEGVVVAVLSNIEGDRLTPSAIAIASAFMKK